MPNPISINPEESPMARFAYEMRHHRLRAGWTQEQLARRLTVAVSTVGMVETSRRRPDQRFADTCDKLFDLDGVFHELWKKTRWEESAPPHFRNFMALEANASTVRNWDPLVIPGLFQIESYARRIFEDEPAITPELVEERIGQRMHRQQILSKKEGPMVVSLIDEGVLHRPLGDATVMRAQMEHLLKIAGLPRVTIQIVPYSSWSAVGLQASFTIAELRGAAYSVYVESAPRGLTVVDRETVAALVGRYDALRAAAATQSQSIGIIEKVMAQWT